MLSGLNANNMVWSHITLSSDGCSATRTQGCRQSVAMGSNGGLYFEVTVDDMVDEWVGGTGIGVTRSVSTRRRGPDKAWRMPNTYIVGYWRCMPGFPHSVSDPCLALSEISPLPVAQGFSSRAIESAFPRCGGKLSFRVCGGAPFGDAGAVIVPRLRR